MIAKGRSCAQTLIEDSAEIFNKILLEIPQYWKEMEVSIEKEFRDIAKRESNGDKEVEIEIYDSQYHGIDEYSDVYSCFYESLILSIYSFYERMLKKIIERNGIKEINGNNNKRKYAMNHINSIKQYLGKITFAKDIESKIIDINTTYRTKRNDIAHEGYEGFHQIDLVFVEELLQKVITVLVDINKLVEAWKNKQTQPKI